MVPSSESQVHGALVIGTVAGFTSVSVMKLGVDADALRQLIAIDLGAKGAVLKVGTCEPHARAPPQVRGKRRPRR